MHLNKLTLSDVVIAADVGHQLGLQVFSCVMKPTHNSPLAHLQNIGNLIIREAVDLS